VERETGSRRYGTGAGLLLRTTAPLGSLLRAKNRRKASVSQAQAGLQPCQVQEIWAFQVETALSELGAEMMGRSKRIRLSRWRMSLPDRLEMVLSMLSHSKREQNDLNPAANPRRRQALPKRLRWHTPMLFV